MHAVLTRRQRRSMLRLDYYDALCDGCSHCEIVLIPGLRIRTACLSLRKPELETLAFLRSHDPIPILIANVRRSFEDVRFVIPGVRKHPRLMLQSAWMLGV